MFPFHGSTMNRALTLAASLLVVAGCSKQPAESPAASQGPATAQAPATPATVADQPPMDAPLKATDVGIGYTLVQAPAYVRGADRIRITVRVQNRGKTVLSSAGKYPIHLGLVLLAPDEAQGAAAQRQDFVLEPLPRALAPGKAVDVAIRFPVGPAVGHRVVLDATQDRVAWFHEYGQPTLEIGRFARCGDKPRSACTPDGKPLPVVH